VEDSVSGVVAGVEAEMTVFGFSGSVTSSEELASAGATTFGAMSELRNLLIGN
jgi:beta-phosphoglucomutase-like phosphatase (HAD superfamily)